MISNVAGAKALARAEKAEVPALVVDHRAFADRSSFDAAIVAELRARGVEYVVLAGFMRLVTPTLLEAFPMRVVNVHPALLPAFPGVDAQAQALRYGVRVAGCTVHFVDAGTDTGPIIAQAVVPVLEGDDEAALRARILEKEHALLPAALQWCAEGRVTVEPAAAARASGRASACACDEPSCEAGAPMAKHYDVAILGTGVGALATAALLARRSWRVVVLGHGHRPAAYTYDGVVLARRAFTFLAAASPAWTRILAELAQSQTFRRHLTPLDPMLQVLGPDLRLALPPEPLAFAREIDREFPAVRRVVDDLYAELGRTNAACDVAFDRDLVWPPGSFWERRETARIAATLPHLDGGGRRQASSPSSRGTTPTAPSSTSRPASPAMPATLPPSPSPASTARGRAACSAWRAARTSWRRSSSSGSARTAGRPGWPIARRRSPTAAGG